MSSIRYYHTVISEEGQYAFIPAERGRWIKTHISALFVGCNNKHCKAAAKSPCISIKALAKFDTRAFQVAVHKERMDAYQKFRTNEASQKIMDDGKIIRMKKKQRRRA